MGKYLGQALMAYRMTPHVATGFLLFLLLYGQEATTSQELGLSSIAKYNTYLQAVEEHTELVHRDFQDAYKTNQHTRERRATKWNQRAGVRAYKFQVGDLVWYGQGRQEKFHRRGLQQWIGPLRITNITPGPKFVLGTLLETGKEEWERVHPSFLKPFRGEPREGQIRLRKESLVTSLSEVKPE